MQACEMDEAEEVFDVVFPSGNESSEVVHPGKEPLYFPSIAIAAQLAAILGSVLSSTSVPQMDTSYETFLTGRSSQKPI